MKRALIGCFVSLIGSMWTMMLVLLANSNAVDSWSTPPGRLLTTLSEKGMMPWFVVSVVAMLLGFVLMAVAYFKKDR